MVQANHLLAAFMALDFMAFITFMAPMAFITSWPSWASWPSGIGLGLLRLGLLDLLGFLGFHGYVVLGQVPPEHGTSLVEALDPRLPRDGTTGMEANLPLEDP